VWRNITLCKYFDEYWISLALKSKSFSLITMSHRLFFVWMRQNMNFRMRHHSLNHIFKFIFWRESVDSACLSVRPSICQAVDLFLKSSICPSIRVSMCVCYGTIDSGSIGVVVPSSPRSATDAPLRYYVCLFIHLSG